jgi:hypothetical protein
MKRVSWAVAGALLAGWLAGAAYGKLPAPTPEEQAKAEAAKTKAAEAAKKDAEALGRAQDRVAERYKREKGIAVKGAGTTEKAAAKEGKKKE